MPLLSSSTVLPSSHNSNNPFTTPTMHTTTTTTTTSISTTRPADDDFEGEKVEKKESTSNDLPATTIPPTTNNNAHYFLQDLPLKTRRSLLALHEMYCHKVKQQHMLTEYAKEESGQTTINLSLLPQELVEEYEARIALNERRSQRQREVHQQRRAKKKRLMGNSKEENNEKEVEELESGEDNHSTTAVIGKPTTSKKKKQADDTKINTTNPITTTTPAATTSIMNLRDKEIPLQSIYEKYVHMFQSFYNDHDPMSILSLLMYPCCSSSIYREMNIWLAMPVLVPMAVSSSMPSSSSTTPSTSMEGYGRSNSIGDIGGNHSFLSIQRQLHRVSSRHFIGRDAFYEDCCKFLNKLPDCIIVYENTNIKRINEQYTMVTSGYSYFFSVPMQVTTIAPIPPVSTTNTVVEGSKSRDGNGDALQPQQQQVSANGNTPLLAATTSLSMIEVELKGCNILYFNSNGIVEREIDHITLKSISNPNVSVGQLMNFLGF